MRLFSFVKVETVLTALTIGLLSCYSKMRYGPVGPTWAVSPDKFFGDDTGLRLVRLDFGDFTNRWLGSSNSSGRSGNSTMPLVLGIASAGNFFLGQCRFPPTHGMLAYGVINKSFLLHV